jgi:iron complex outermembrane receptor protein
LATDGIGQFDFTLAANFNDTNVTKTPGLPKITSLPQPAFLFDRGNVLTYEKGTPQSKLVGSVDWEYGNAGVTWKTTHYANVLIPNNNPTFDYSTGDAWLMDLEFRYKLPMNVGAAFGINNMFDKYPNFTPGTINSPTGSIGFPSYSPYGFNGRFLYGRLSVNW